MKQLRSGGYPPGAGLNAFFHWAFTDARRRKAYGTLVLIDSVFHHRRRDSMGFQRLDRQNEGKVPAQILIPGSPQPIRFVKQG